MLLFDLEYYTDSGIIGPNAECASRNDWEDMHTTARATKDAFLKATFEWYNSAVVCLDKNNPCYKNIVDLWSKFREFIVYFDKIHQEFFESHYLENKSFTDDICNRYRKALIDLKCMLRQLLRLVDGDFNYTKSLYE